MPQLDGIRCFAALTVVARHVALGRYMNVGQGLGAYAVWLFFVLSGFLITDILLRARDSEVSAGQSLRVFYARRFLRILPLYYVALLAGAYIGIGRSFRADLGWHLAYLSNWMMAARGSTADYATPLWSLGVEEQFYLVWPALVLFTPRRRLFSVLVAMGLVGIASRVLLVAAGFNDGSSVTVWSPSTSNLDPLALGALLAWHGYSRPLDVETRRRWTRIALLAGALMFTAIAVLWSLQRGLRLRLVIEALSAGLMSVWLVDRAATGFAEGTIGATLLNARVTRYLGTISYGIYVLHGAVRWSVMQTPARFMLDEHSTLPEAFASFLIVLGGTVALASVSWYGMERPLNSLKRRFEYGRPPSAVDASPQELRRTG